MNVVVVGCDVVVGRTLELLLLSADCQVSFVADFRLKESGRLKEADLLVLGPGLTKAQEEDALSASAPSARYGPRPPVIKLVPDLRQATSDGEFQLVPWPCRAEELERQMMEALANASRARADEKG